MILIEQFLFTWYNYDLYFFRVIVEHAKRSLRERGEEVRYNRPQRPPPRRADRLVAICRSPFFTNLAI